MTYDRLYQCRTCRAQFFRPPMCHITPEQGAVIDAAIALIHATKHEFQDYLDDLGAAVALLEASA